MPRSTPPQSATDHRQGSDRVDEQVTEPLWQAYRSTGSPHAREQLITLHMPFVRRLAQRTARLIGSEVCVDDLTSAGFFGLAEAIDSYDPSRGTSFRTFCAYRVRGAILDELRANDWVPRLVRQNARRHEQAVHDLQQLLGRDPAEGEVAAHLRVDRHTYCTIRRDAQPTEVSSLQATRHRSTTGEADAALAQVVADHRLVSPIASAMRNEMRDMICQSLSPAQRLIITLYYFEGMTMKEIGRTMNLSESRVSQMHATILARIRSRLKRLNLADITDVLDDAAA